MGKLKKLFRSDYIRNALVLAGGTAAAQLIGILSALVLTRIYMPEYYGMLTIYTAISALLGCMASFQFHNVIITTRSTAEVSNAISACLITSLLVSAATLVVALIFFNRFDYWFGHYKGKYWMLFIPVSVFMTGFNYTLSSLAARLGKFRLLAITRIVGALLVSGLSILLGVLLHDETGLFAGFILSQFVPAVMLWRAYRKTSFGHTKLSWAALRLFCREHKNYPFFVLPSEIISTLINMLPVFMLTRQYSGVRNGLTGHYGRSTLILGLPVQLVASALGEVFRQKAAKEFGSPAQLRRTFVHTAGLLFVLSIVPFAVVMLYGPWIFRLLMGPQWGEAGAMASALAMLFALRFTVTPLTYMYNIVKKQRENFMMHLLMLGAGFASFGISNYVYPGEHLKALWLYGGAYCAIYVIYFFRSYQFCAMGAEEAATTEEAAPALMAA